MTWRDQIQSGSFRGIPFLVDSHQLSGGRRVVKHEYPGKDKPGTEDMGRKAKDFSLEFYVVGSDYMDARDQLIDALDAGGAGLLVHPYYGRMQVNVETYNLRESVREGGKATFSVSFCESGDTDQPSRIVDSSKQTSESAAALSEAAVVAFTEQYSANGLPSWAIDGLTDTLDQIAGSLRIKTADLLDNINSPAVISQSIVNAAVSIVAEVGYSISAFQRAAAIGLDIPPLPFTTSLRQQQSRNQAALIQLSRQATLAAAANLTAAEAFPARNDASAVLVAASASVDALQSDSGADGAVLNDNVYFALADLKTALNTDLQTRGLRLPEMASYIPVTTQPALVIAHHLYGDASRDGEIIDRNGIQSPGFVVGGEALEVLSNE